MQVSTVLVFLGIVALVLVSGGYAASMVGGGLYDLYQDMKFVRSQRIGLEQYVEHARATSYSYEDQWTH